MTPIHYEILLMGAHNLNLGPISQVDLQVSDTAMGGLRVSTSLQTLNTTKLCRCTVQHLHENPKSSLDLVILRVERNHEVLVQDKLFDIDFGNDIVLLQIIDHTPSLPAGTNPSVSNKSCCKQEI